MEKSNEMRLPYLSKVSLRKRQMNSLRGGGGDCSGPCACGCDGSSTTSTNRDANNTTYTPYSGFNKEDGFWTTECVFG